MKLFILNLLLLNRGIITKWNFKQNEKIYYCNIFLKICNNDYYHIYYRVHDNKFIFQKNWFEPVFCSDKYEIIIQKIEQLMSLELR